jgi:hypothetical protein
VYVVGESDQRLLETIRSNGELALANEEYGINLLEQLL